MDYNSEEIYVYLKVLYGLVFKVLICKAKRLAAFKFILQKPGVSMLS